MKFIVKVNNLYGKLSYMLRPERILMHLGKDIIFRIATDNKEVFLTFDDGPHPDRTMRILEILGQFNIKATFFVIGRNVEKYPSVLLHIHNAGHSIANHTYSHKRLPYLNEDEFWHEIRKVEKLFQDMHIPLQKVLRPPFGLIRPRQIEALSKEGYQVVMGDVYPRDSNSASTKEIIERVRKDVQAGSVVILHDGTPPGDSLKFRSSTLFALNDILGQLKADGYQFSTLSTLDN